MYIQHDNSLTDSTSVTTTCTTATVSPIGIINSIANIASYCIMANFDVQNFEDAAFQTFS